MVLIDEFKTIFGEALARFAEERKIGKSQNSILIFPDNDSDAMQLQFLYCLEAKDGFVPASPLLWNQVYGSDDWIMNRNIMMAQFFLQAFIRTAREEKCEPTDVGIMVIFENDDSEEVMLFAYNKFNLITDIETKLKKVIPIDEIFMDLTM